MIQSLTNVRSGRRFDPPLLSMSISYSFFLLLSLVLVVCLFRVRDKQEQKNYWNQNLVSFQNSSNLMDNHLSLMESFSRELIADDSFYQLVNYTDTSSGRFYIKAMQVKDSLSARIYVDVLPVDIFYVYLRNTDYVLSLRLFETDTLFFGGKRHYRPEQFENWQALMNQEDSLYLLRPMDGYRSDSSQIMYMYIIDLGQLSYRTIPATICFELDADKLYQIFQGLLVSDGSMLLITDPDHTNRIELSKDRTSAVCDPDQLEALDYQNGQADLPSLSGTRMHVTRLESQSTDWIYYLIQPASLAVSSPNYYFLFYFLLLPALTLFGILVVAATIRKNMQPIHQLNTRLQEVITDKTQLETDKAQLQVEMEEQKPYVCDSYVRRLFSGLVTSREELEYIRAFLRLDREGIRFNALYGIAYSNHDTEDPMQTASGSETPEAALAKTVSRALTEYLQAGSELPVHVFVTPDHAYVALLAYEEDDDSFLLHVQEKILRLHDNLLEQHSIWLYTGMGRACPSLQQIWECYQQAMDAVSYSGKNYIFLPYELIRKDSNVFYYPSELSNKLIHFITTGNRVQVMELFNLIHEENIEQRALPINLLKYLLSDIRNTLLKARFTVRGDDPETLAKLETLDTRFNDHLSFKLCEDLALELCGFFRVQSGNDGLIGMIEAYIRENFRDPSMCLSKISEEFNISETYFSHLFKEKTNSNFSVYLEDLRLNEALRRIQEKDCRLSELYLEVGYNNASSFRRAFKKKYGVPPSAMMP